MNIKMKIGPLLFRITAIVVFLQLILGGLLTFNFIEPTIHIITGLIVFILALATMVVAFATKPSFKPVQMISILIVVLIVVQIILGIDALNTNSSAIAWVHFVVAMAIYGASVSGTFLAIRWNMMLKGGPSMSVGMEQQGEPNRLSSKQAGTTGLSRTDFGRRNQDHRNTIIILQLSVGSLVTMGGSLFATLSVNRIGTALGLVHLLIGITGLIAGIVILQSKSWSPNFLLVINALTIAYSAFSESIVQIQSLLPISAAIGSLIGTLIAIAMSCLLIYLISSLQRRNHSLHPDEEERRNTDLDP